MNNRFLDEINYFNSAVEGAKERFKNKEMVDNNLEFLDEIDLQRYIDSCNYEKVEMIKDYLNSHDVLIEDLNDEDKELIKKIIRLMKLLPKNLHKCIGCPCLENDYPHCENCSFQESCLSGNSPYPDECIENDCRYAFEYLKNLNNSCGS